MMAQKRRIWDFTLIYTAGEWHNWCLAYFYDRLFMAVTVQLFICVIYQPTNRHVQLPTGSLLEMKA